LPDDSLPADARPTGGNASVAHNEFAACYNSLRAPLHSETFAKHIQALSVKTRGATQKLPLTLDRGVVAASPLILLNNKETKQRS